MRSAPSEQRSGWLVSEPLIRIRNWDQFQHYKKRSPVWIKLYRDLLRKREWRVLSPQASKLLVDCWLLAAEGENNGKIDMTLGDLAWELRDDEAEVGRALQELAAQGFLDLCEPLASKKLSVA